MVDIVEADKTDIYFIQESVYGKIGLPAFGNTIGPSAQQVVKKVFAVVKERDKTHAKQRLLLEYNGNKLWMNAIDGSEAILPTEFSKRYELSLFNTTNFGEDPFPDANLYNNMKSSFFVRFGGTSHPEAWAIYNASTKEVKYIETAREIDKIFSDFNLSGTLPIHIGR
ncbi:hypothetical protein LRV83_004705 [Escherichia coli]|nr:hypothetical protein [Escherichia coli]